MVQRDYTKKREKGKNLTLAEREKIEKYFNKDKLNKSQIARLLNINVRTIKREIKRGMVYGLLNSDLIKDNLPYKKWRTYTKTRNKTIRNKSAKSSKAVLTVMKDILKEYKIRTLTSDNGIEFLELGELEKTNGIEVFYAHNYCSWERGSNENNNKLIRRYYPKGTDFTNVSENDISKLQDWINNYPRKLFNGNSSKNIYKNRTVSIAI